jgi:hypothetical protein
VDTPTVVPWQCAGLETSTPWDKIWSLNLYLTYLAFCSFLRCVVPMSRFSDQFLIFWEKRCKWQNASNVEKRFEHLMIFDDRWIIFI